MSGLFDMLSKMNGAGNGNSILLRAIGAAIRGEDAHEFLRQISNEYPELKRQDLSDLQGTAQKLAQQKGVDIDTVTKEIDGVVAPFIQK